MPAVITHDLFGKDVLRAKSEPAYPGANSGACRDAFLLGNQGPDPFFYGVLDPLLVPVWGLGTKMHRQAPDKLLTSLVSAACALEGEERALAQAYAQGMLCHYLLDSTMHPFIYAQQYAYCNAGVRGLNHRDGHEVHAEIESELDLVALTAKTGLTIRDFEPSKEILRAAPETLATLSHLMKHTVGEVFGKHVPSFAFAHSVRAYRLTLSALYSPRGTKRTALGCLERLVRRHSFLRALSHRCALIPRSPFENAEHESWVDPASKVKRTESFWDLYESALARACELVPALPALTPEAAARITQGLDFNGRPCRAPY